MAIFYFSQFKHELCWRYFKHLNAILAQYVYCVIKWEILDIVDEDVNSETCILLEYWDFHGKNVEEACYLLKLIAWDSFEFEKASRVSRYSFPNPCAFYAPFWYDFCNASDHNINSCPSYACNGQPDFVSPWDNTNVVLTLPDSPFPLA